MLSRCAETVYAKRYKQSAVDVIMSAPQNDPPIISIELMQHGTRCAFIRLTISRPFNSTTFTIRLAHSFCTAFCQYFLLTEAHTRTNQTRLRTIKMIRSVFRARSTAGF